MQMICTVISTQSKELKKKQEVVVLYTHNYLFLSQSIKFLEFLLLLDILQNHKVTFLHVVHFIFSHRLNAWYTVLISEL